MRVPRPVYRRYGYDYWQQLPDEALVKQSLCLDQRGRVAAGRTVGMHYPRPSNLARMAMRVFRG